MSIHGEGIGSRRSFGDESETHVHVHIEGAAPIPPAAERARLARIEAVAYRVDWKDEARKAAKNGDKEAQRVVDKLDEKDDEDDKPKDDKQKKFGDDKASKKTDELPEAPEHDKGDGDGDEKLLSDGALLRMLGRARKPLATYHRSVDQGLKGAELDAMNKAMGIASASTRADRAQQRGADLAQAVPVAARAPGAPFVFDPGAFARRGKR